MMMVMVVRMVMMVVVMRRHIPATLYRYRRCALEERWSVGSQDSGCFFFGFRAMVVMASSS